MEQSFTDFLKAWANDPGATFDDFSKEELEEAMSHFEGNYTAYEAALINDIIDEPIF